jgi:gliding motility-associated protein GldC
MGKSSNINLTITLDESNIPESITWMASDSSMQQPEACKAFMLSLYDEKQEETLRIDLWNKEMRQDEMDKFFFETFMTMSDTYKRANQNEEIVQMMRAFAFQFGEKAGVIKRKTE